MFIKNFSIYDKISEGRLYITGLGLYQAFLNQKKVGKAYLTPGFNDYNYYLRYQAYDIKKYLQEENNLEIHIGNGWYKGRIGILNNGNQENIWGNEYKLCAHIIIN